VVVPGDAEEARKAVIAAAEHEGPVYLRFGRAATPLFTTSETPFEVGKALGLWEPRGGKKPRAAIFSTGALSYEAFKAAQALEADAIAVSVLHVPTVKPLDVHAIVEAAQRAGAVVTVEEHQAAGGFGSAVAEVLAEHAPVPMRLVAVRDQFGQSGEPGELLAHYGLDAAGIEKAVKSLLS
jgi:transketolase